MKDKVIETIRNRPMWYKVWGASVLISFLYYMAKLLFFELHPADQIVPIYLLISMILDPILFSKKKQENNQAS